MNRTNQVCLLQLLVSTTAISTLTFAASYTSTPVEENTQVPSALLSSRSSCLDQKLRPHPLHIQPDNFTHRDTKLRTLGCWRGTIWVLKLLDTSLGRTIPVWSLSGHYREVPFSLSSFCSHSRNPQKSPKKVLKQKPHSKASPSRRGLLLLTRSFCQSSFFPFWFVYLFTFLRKFHKRPKKSQNTKPILKYLPREEDFCYIHTLFARLLFFPSSLPFPLLAGGSVASRHVNVYRLVLFRGISRWT